LVIEGVDEVHHIDTVRTQSGTDWGCRGSFAAIETELDDTFDGLFSLGHIDLLVVQAAGDLYPASHLIMLSLV
jgi:hypothetical protein